MIAASHLLSQVRYQHLDLLSIHVLLVIGEGFPLRAILGENLTEIARLSPILRHTLSLLSGELLLDEGSLFLRETKIDPIILRPIDVRVLIKPLYLVPHHPITLDLCSIFEDILAVS